MNSVSFIHGNSLHKLQIRLTYKHYSVSLRVLETMEVCKCFLTT